MVRRYHDTIDVQSAEAPSAFVWRGRLYVVREVLDHWRERRAWWREALDPQDGAGPVGGDREQEVWRVEASAGRLRGTGVYDLTRDGPTGPGGERQWQHVRVAD